MKSVVLLLDEIDRWLESRSTEAVAVRKNVTVAVSGWGCDLTMGSNGEFCSEMWPLYAYKCVPEHTSARDQCRYGDSIPNTLLAFDRPWALVHSGLGFLRCGYRVDWPMAALALGCCNTWLRRGESSYL